MRICHLADLHFTEERFAECEASINTVIAEHRRAPFDLIAIAGDIWDGAVQNSARAKFAAFLDLIRRIADCAPVAMIYGTPSHDTEGSLDVFEALETTSKVWILRPGVPYYLQKRDGIPSRITQKMESGRAMLLFGVPEPNKKWLLANREATGKDATDEAVRAAMGALFLGLGGMRKEHPDLPCVLLYHGQVVGAKSGTGYTAGSGIAVTRDQLAMVGADYLALGDIHEPQQIPGLPAYYPGSIVPQNWGETHKAGANVVEIEPGKMVHDPLFNDDKRSVDISRLDFPHPQLAHIKMPWKVDPSTGMRGPEEAEIIDRRVWLEWIATPEEAREINEESDLEWLTSHGALYGSKVTTYRLPTETVRAGDIAEKKTLREKIAVWADNSTTPVPESAYAKADDLEREAAARGSAGSGAHIRINRLILRGAVGIFKNQRKDEIDLDLDTYGPGVIAMIGSNGAGKTTIFLLTVE